MYLVVSFAAFALLNAWTGVITGAGDHRDFVVFGILMIAAVSRLLFWRASLNFAEHLILTIYLFGHVILFLAFMQIPIHFAGTSRTAVVLTFAALALAVAYFPWAYSRFFDRRPVLSAAGGLTTLVGGLVLWFYGSVAIMSVLRARGII